MRLTARDYRPPSPLRQRVYQTSGSGVEMVLDDRARAQAFDLLRILAKRVRSLLCPDDGNIKALSDPSEPDRLSHDGGTFVNRRHQPCLQVDQNDD